MRPVLFYVGNAAIPAFQTLLVLAFLGAALIGLRLGPRLGIARRRVIEFAAAATLWGVLGAKLGHCLFEAPGHLLPDGSTTSGIADLLAADPWHCFRLLDGGYVWYGGLLLASVALVCHARWRRVDRGALADLAAPGIACGIAIGRLGCFCAGCCYGVPSSLPWAVRFPAEGGGLTVPLHPVQLYDAVFGLLLLALLWWRLPRRRFSGELFALTLTIYSVVRFGLECLRGDEDRGLYFEGLLSTSQIISIAIFPVALYYLLRGYRLATLRGAGACSAPHSQSA
ncbi:MAG: prolipoprotein diacylglyceryl transferase [Deltaproteobacteria bacterium]|nr:prolipoprotein diacylglyceryl transferase [Deltaproteobacteria bacterium]